MFQGTKTPYAHRREEERTQTHNIDKYKLSSQISTLLTSLLKQHPTSARQFPSQKLAQMCQVELQRLSKAKKNDFTFKGRVIDNQLTISVLGLHARIFLYQQYKALDRKNRHIYEHESCFQIGNAEQNSRMSHFTSKGLADKVVQLSRSCEQVTQLEMFNHALQQSQLESSQKVAFLRVVKVLLNLHQRVTYLSRQKPQLIKELESGVEHCRFINCKIEQFFGEISNQTQRVAPISFIGSENTINSQLNEDFIELKENLSRISQIVISQNIFATENFRKMQRIIRIVQSFHEVLSGNRQTLQQWMELMTSLHQEQQSYNLYHDQFKLLMMLDQCLSLKEATARMRKSSRDHHHDKELEMEVNKLIEDYERLKVQNQQLMNQKEEERRIKRELLAEVGEKDQIIDKLSGKKQNVTSKIRLPTIPTFSKIFEEGQYKKNEDELERMVSANQQLKKQMVQLQKIMKNRSEVIPEQTNIWTSRVQKIGKEKEELKLQLEKIQEQKDGEINGLHMKMDQLESDKTFLESKLEILAKNNARLNEQLESTQKKLDEYNLILMVKNQQKKQEALKMQKQSLQKDLDEAVLLVEKYGVENKTFKQEIDILRFQLNQTEMFKENPSLKNTSGDIKTQLNRAQAKNQSYSEAIKKLKVKQKQYDKVFSKQEERMKQMLFHMKNLQNQKNRLEKQLEEKDSSTMERRKEVAELRQKSLEKKQITITHKKQITQKQALIENLKSTIKNLQEQLVFKTPSSKNILEETAEIKLKQYTATIQTYKMFEVKMEEQNKNLRKQIESHIEKQAQLGINNKQLKKEIENVRAKLKNCQKQLSEKQKVILMEQSKNDVHIKKIRQLQIRQEVKKSQSTTPMRQSSIIEKRTKDTKSHQKVYKSQTFSTPSKTCLGLCQQCIEKRRVEDISREYNQFKRISNIKIENLQAELRQSKQKVSKLEKTNGEESRQEELKKRIKILEEQIKELNVKLEQERKERKQVEANLEEETKGMFNHYQSEMKRVIAETDSINNQLKQQKQILVEELTNTLKSQNFLQFVVRVMTLFHGYELEGQEMIYFRKEVWGMCQWYYGDDLFKILQEYMLKKLQK